MNVRIKDLTRESRIKRGFKKRELNINFLKMRNLKMNIQKMKI